MKQALKDTLQTALENWVLAQCDHEDRPSVGLIHDKLGKHMTEAAAAVYDATFEGQRYAKQQGFVA